MAQQVSPTKGNLIKIKKTLQLAQLGYELLDRKRNILIRETMQKIEEAKHLEEDMRTAYSKAHEAIKYANMQLGIVDVVAAAVRHNRVSPSFKCGKSFLISSVVV